MSIVGIPKMRNECTKVSIVIVIVENYCRQSPLIVSIYNRAIELDHSI